MVKISMETFVKRFQPENYDKWKNGLDNGPHPEDLNLNSSQSTLPTFQKSVTVKMYVKKKNFII